MKSPAHIIRFFFRWVLLCCIIGLSAGAASAFFLQTLEWVTNFRELHVWVIALLPIGGLLIGLLYHYYGKEVVTGNQLLIETIRSPKKIIPWKMAPFVYLGTIVTHFLGGSAGREGTALQMSGAIADQFSKPFHLSDEERKVLLIASIAAGFGSVFGTPFAGIVFSLELMRTGQLKYKAFIPATIAAILADQVTRFLQTPHAQYTVAPIPELKAIDLLYAAIAGLAFGSCALTFCKGLRGSSELFKRLIPYPPVRPVIGGVLVALSVWALGSTKYIGLGIPTILASFDGVMPSYDFALKILFTIVTLSAGFKGGEVTPLFFIGALLGNALHPILPLPIDLLAAIGFVAVFAAATNTPIACTIMAVELFGFQTGGFALIACLVAYFVSGHHTIYSSSTLHRN